MDTVKKISEVAERISSTAEIDDVAVIVRRAVDEAIDKGMTGLQLRLFLKRLNNRLHKCQSECRHVIIQSNLKEGISIVEHFEDLFFQTSRHYEQN